MRRMQLVGLVLVALVVLMLLGSLLSGLGGGSGDAVAPGEPTEAVKKRVRVEVLNAAGVPGLARTATEMLRERGFDVVFYGNATGFEPDTSVILDRVGTLETAEQVAAALDIERVRTAVDSTLFVDVSVILGRDWAQAEAALDSAGAR